MRAIEVEERRDCQHSPSPHGVQPGEVEQVVALVLDIPNALRLLCRIIRYLVVIPAQRNDESKLIVRSLIKDE